MSTKGKNYMKYVSVREWILSDVNLYYDFVEDTIVSLKSLEKYKKIDSVLEKFFIYRAELYNNEHNDLLINTYKSVVNDFVKNAKDYKTKDPDAYSGLLRQIYTQLWGYVFLDKYCRCSDTMTSAQKLVNNCINCVEKENLNSIYIKKNFRITVNSSIALAACNEKTDLYVSLKSVVPELEKFLCLYHTIGNYSPIPDGFNVPRSSGGQKDFWDLTLMFIRKYYLQDNKKEKNKIVTEELLNNHKYSKLEKVIAWLDFYGNGESGWKRFVEFNFFQDYVNGDNEVIPFWEGHNENNLQIPTNPQDLKKALNNICDLIEKRGRKIVDTIRMTDGYTFYHC